MSKRNKKKKEKPRVVTLKELSDILPLEETDAPGQRHSNFGLVQYQSNLDCEYWAVPMIKGLVDFSAFCVFNFGFGCLNFDRPA